MRKDGKIYGRGTQDMKVWEQPAALVRRVRPHHLTLVCYVHVDAGQCVCAQYILALERLLSDGFQPRRTLHLSYVPDEEVGGEGMASLLASDLFKTLHVGLALDEGIANPGACRGLSPSLPSRSSSLSLYVAAWYGGGRG